MRALCGLILIIATACMQGSRVPAVSPTRTLEVGAADASGDSEGPFRVVFAGPEGEAPSTSELSIVFSRALRELSLAGAEAAPPIRIEPPIPGRWQWVGTRALVFVPERGRLPGATRARVEVPAGTRALDGSTLPGPYRFEFETPRPAIARSAPYSGQRGLTPDTTISLYFNQAVDPAELERRSTLVARRGSASTRLRFEAKRPDPASPKRVELRPSQPLPIHSRIVLELAKELRAEEGPLPFGDARRIEFETYGPLVVERISCDDATPNRRCAPGSTLGVTFSNPVRLRDVKRVLGVGPNIALRWDNSRVDDDETTYVSVVAAFKAATTYTLRVGGELKDRYGQKLGRAHVAPIAFDDFWPNVEIGARGDYLEPAAVRPIAIGSVNVDRFDLVSAALTADDVVRLNALDQDKAQLALVEKIAGASRRTITPRAPKNQLAKELVTPSAVLGGAAKRGPLAVGTRFKSPQRGSSAEAELAHDVQVLQLTDLALSAKLSRHGSLVWVTRLSNGQPVAGASVELREPAGPARRYQTDARGIALIPAKDFAPNFYRPDTNRAVLFARSGDDWTFRAARHYVEPWRLSVDSDLSGTQKAYGLLFTERGIYRPGDSVELKGIVRVQSPHGNEIPAGRAIEVVLRSPKEEEILKKKVTTTRFGTFAVDFRVPRAAELGSWQILARGLESGEIYESFEVAEYRPAEFKVSVESSKPAYVRGDQASWTARGDYLFGAPMGRAKVRYRVTRGPTIFAPPESDGFVTDASAYFRDFDQEALDAGEIHSAEGALDARGEARFAAKLELPGQLGPEIVSADAEVTDVTRQALGSGTTAVVHPAEFYLGLKLPEDYFVQAPGKLDAKVVALAPDGKRIAGKRTLVELIRRRWTLARQESSGGGLHSVSKPVDAVVSSCQIATAALPAGCAFDVKEGGYYVLHATAKDGRGNVAHAAVGMYAIGGGGASWTDSDKLSLELVPNKKQYKVGDKARVLVKSPFPEAEAIVTVERAGVYRSERTKLKGPTPTVEVPIGDELRPNAYVGVHLVRPRTKPPPRGRAEGDVGAPTFRVGYAELKIDPEARRLKVDVRPHKRDLSPGDMLRVAVQVNDGRGKPERAEVTLYAVDEGVLSLIGYKTPDPIPVFTASRPLQVATLESRDALARLSLVELGGALGLDKGQEGGGGGSSARRDFRQSAYFNPEVLTDAAGKAEVSFKLPESLTTYRVMAIATTAGDHYGYGQASVVTSKRLMARPALPRFLRTGDTLEAGVVVTAKSFGPADVDVRATVSGVELSGDPVRRVRIQRDQSVEVRFPVRATKAGNASLRFDVKSENERDAVEVKRRVVIPTLMESVALYGETKRAAGEKLGDLSAARKDVGTLELSVASTALVGLDGGVEQLVEYPYGCTEQLSSRLLPLLPLSDMARDFRIALPPDTPKLVDKTVADLLGRQRGDGGFGMWPDSPDSSPWVSAYTLWTLHEARRRGESVPPRVIERGRAYLRRYLDEVRNEPLYLATSAFLVDVLAELGAPDIGYMSRLYEARSRLPLFGKALLLHALAISKQKATLIDTLVSEIENQLRIEANAAFVAENLGDEYAVLMDSPARTGALVLRALIAARPAHALGGKLARGLLQQRHGGTWRSTQETAYALLALDGYRKAQEKAVPDYVARIWMGESELLQAAMRGRSIDVKKETIPLAALRAGPGAVLAFQKEGEGTLFYEARLRYARKTLPSQPLDRGFFVQKTLRPVTADGLEAALRTIPEQGATRITGGDLVIVDLVIVTSSPREYVVIDDPLPAGLEGVDARLATTASWLRVAGSGGEPGSVDCVGCDPESDDAIAHGRAFLASWYRQEVRDDRVLFFLEHMAAGMYHYRYLARATSYGTFIVPPTKAEAMYSPEVFGRTGATRVEVAGKKP